MNDPRLASHERIRYVAIRERLRADDPEIDERTLADTVEGLTDFTDILAAIVRAAIKDKVYAEALTNIIEDMEARRARLEDRAERRRCIVLDEMQAAGLPKLTLPEFTVSIRNNPPKLQVIDESKIPPDYFEMRPHLKKRELLAAMKGGAQVEGAELSNPYQSLMVRTR